MRKNYLLSLPKVNLSARILATKLGLDHTSVVRDYAPTIRYGNSSGIFEDDTEFNSPDAIKLCGSSLSFSKWCNDNNINTPLYTPFSDVEKPYTFPFLLRKEYHRGGRDIKLVKDDEDLLNLTVSDYFYVPFIETHVELGIHIIHGKVVRIFRKTKVDENAHPFIRSANFGYHYKLIRDMINNYAIAQKLALSVFDKIHLEFGRVDMGYNETEKKYVIFEINTAPGLNINSAEVYAATLREILNV